MIDSFTNSDSSNFHTFLVNVGLAIVGEVV